MITFWQQENGKLRKCADTIPDENQNTWIDVRSVTHDDITILESEYQIDQEHILDILDQDELSRIETTDTYTLIIVRLPMYKPETDITYQAVPVGIVLFPKKIITICWSDCDPLKDIAANRIRDLVLKDSPAFVMRLLSRSDTTFLRYLKEINRRAGTIQNELATKVNNNDLIQLMNLQKSLVFFTTALRSNQLLLERLSVTKILPLDEDDREWLDDVVIDNRQAMEMADTYTNILQGITDAFNSVISNNMNIVMKRLSVINLVMMAPTFITSIFGMNFKLQFENLPGYIPVILASLLCVISIFISIWLLGHESINNANAEKKPRKVREKQVRKKHKAEKKVSD